MEKYCIYELTCNHFDIHSCLDKYSKGCIIYENKEKLDKIERKIWDKKLSPKLKKLEKLNGKKL